MATELYTKEPGELKGVLLDALPRIPDDWTIEVIVTNIGAVACNVGTLIRMQRGDSVAGISEMDDRIRSRIADVLISELSEFFGKTRT